MTDTAVRQDVAQYAEGAPVPGFTRPAGLEAWNRYAAVNDEFVGIHMDDEAGKAAGYPGAIGMGNLIWGWLHCMVDEWVGEHGRLAHLECRFRAPALKGDEVVCGGVVTARETAADGTATLTVDVWADRSTGDRLVSGTARVTLNA
ncbi:MaoC/PaaZ C-terminal domain-containing protein [Actinocorallia sp. A-T 12471]|uniref:MaoC/PaaZ C-terminal domain-containing protein n=1 Tax=Actinocorallia sp. A-T 12471 TaxID=3089813 RepID=UPI0029D0D1BC|nr:MaoC/PaaZ C-terminal domain-containing protein [Actinocorallia sp. A-T 12471]MDX6742167.1 MaoC/PaaZ C-terminal domain-containing protein [Actinocorallia sp. A-T 12471]